jgi:hypothetical protein
MRGVSFHRLYGEAVASILHGMKNREFKTKFWRDAATSLPARYKLDLQRAESWELALAGAIELVSRARSALFQTPRTAH